MSKNTHTSNTTPVPAIRPEESADLIALESGASSDIDTTDEYLQPVVPIQSRIAEIQPDTTGKRIVYTLLKRKWLAGLVVLAMVIGVLAAVPFTRYSIASIFIKHTVMIVVKDDSSHAPLAGLLVSFDSRTGETDSKGIVRFSDVPVGDHKIKTVKDQYKPSTHDITVPIFNAPAQYEYQVASTGKNVAFTVTDTIRGVPVTSAVIKTATASVTTNSQGQATLIVPLKTTDLKATINAKNYRQAEVAVDTNKGNEVNLTEVGSVVFLSKESGTLDVVKTNLDGTDRTVIAKGTGNEDVDTTTLLATQDWKFAALKSKKEANKKAVITTINIETGVSTTAEQEPSEYNLVGWSGHTLIYTMDRTDMQTWQPKKMSIKSFNVDSGKKVVIDESLAEGSSQSNSAFQVFNNPYILDNSLTYTTSWSGMGLQAVDLQTGKQASVRMSSVDGVTKKVVKSYELKVSNVFNGKRHLPQEVYYETYAINSDGPPKFSELKNGEIKDGITKPANFDTTTYPMYLLSPNGTQSFWSESRDGKQALLVGDKNAGSKTEITTKSDYAAYGWYTNDYLLVQKSNSELFITTKDQLKAGIAPVKVSDYQK